MYLSQHHRVYMSQQTYGNHPNFFSAAGIAIETYRYYDPGTCGLDFQGNFLRINATFAFLPSTVDCVFRRFIYDFCQKINKSYCENI